MSNSKLVWVMIVTALSTVWYFGIKNQDIGLLSVGAAHVWLYFYISIAAHGTAGISIGRAKILAAGPDAKRAIPAWMDLTFKTAFCSFLAWHGWLGTALIALSSTVLIELYHHRILSWHKEHGPAIRAMRDAILATVRGPEEEKKQ